MTALAMASSNCKRQTRPLVRERERERERLTSTNPQLSDGGKYLVSPRWVLYSKLYLPTDRRS
jgi:hypothetical protein